MTSYTAASIKTMPALEHIRAFTSRYLGEFDTPHGHTHQIKELIDNAVDEADASNDRRHEIHVTVIQLPKAIQVIVEDQGRGIPLQSLTAAYSEPRTSGKWSGAYSASAGVHGEGAKAVAAISRRFVGLSRRPQERGVGMVEVCEGQVYREDVTKLTAAETRPMTSGVLVFFESDPKFLTTAGDYCSPEGGHQLLVNLLGFLSVFVPNTTFHLYRGTVSVKDSLFREEPAKIWETLSTVYRGDKVMSTTNMSRRDYVIQQCRIRSEPVWEFAADRVMKEVPTQDTENQLVSTSVDLFVTKDLEYGLISAVNLIPISDPGSFHFTVIQRVLKERMARFITNKAVRDFFLTQYKFPLCGSVVVRVRMPKFGGQTKDFFRDKAFIDPYHQVVAQMTSIVTETRWADLYDRIVEHLNAEYYAFINRNLTSAQGLKNIGLRLANPDRYSDCDSKDPERTELFITEGNSAGGIVAQVRDPSYQAVFTMRGKTLNALRCDFTALGNNEVLQDLIKVLGIGSGAKDLSGLNFNKIILLTDADSDGHHIATLLIGFLFKLAPQVLESGRVYISNPPLYSLCVGKSKYYLKDDRALMDARIEKLYSPALGVRLCNPVTRAFKDLRDPEDYRSYFYAVKHAGMIIDQLAKNTAIDAAYLEALTQVVDYLTPETMDTERIRKILGVDRVTYDATFNALVVVCRHIDLVIPLAGLAAKLKEELIPVLQEMHAYEVIPQVTFLRSPDKEPEFMTIYKLYACVRQLDDLLPIDRYKGLGEMRPIELSRSCVDPSTRSYFVITSIGDVNQLYAALGTDPRQRKQLLA